MSRAQPPNPAGSRKISFNVSEQYDIQDVVGEGAYGVVWFVRALCPIEDIQWLTGYQLCDTQALGPEGRHQEDHAL